MPFPVPPRPVSLTPPGRGRGQGALALSALAEIAAGLAQTAPAGAHLWTEGARRYAKLLDTESYDAWLIAW